MSDKPVIIIDGKEFRLPETSLESAEFHRVYKHEFFEGQVGSFTMDDGRKVWFKVTDIESEPGE